MRRRCEGYVDPVEYVAGGIFLLLVAIPIAWRAWLWRHDDEYTRAMTREVDGRIVEPSATEPWIRLVHHLRAKRRKRK